MTPNALIEIVNVGFQYVGAEKVALKNISLSIQKGEVVAIVGHNGSGKSTLCKMLNALLLPAEGTVPVDGMDTRDEKNLLEIRRRVGMVFQNPDNELVTTIVEEDVGFGPENLGVPPAEIRARVDAALREVEMSAYAEKASHDYGVDTREILVELGRRRMVGGQEDMIVDVALDLASRG